MASPPASDDSAIIAASLTEPELFAACYDRYAAMLHRFAARRVGAADAEDIVAATFLAAFRARGRYDLTRSDARPWLYGILTKEIARRHRTEEARYRALAKSVPSRPAASHDEQVADDVTAQSVRGLLAAALADLSPADRGVLLLIAWGDLSYAEAADALGIPIGTVRSRLNRARRKVRAALGGTDPTACTDKE